MLRSPASPFHRSKPPVSLSPLSPFCRSWSVATAADVIVAASVCVCALFSRDAGAEEREKPSAVLRTPRSITASASHTSTRRSLRPIPSVLAGSLDHWTAAFLAHHAAVFAPLLLMGRKEEKDQDLINLQHVCKTGQLFIDIISVSRELVLQAWRGPGPDSSVLLVQLHLMA